MLYTVISMLFLLECIQNNRSKQSSILPQQLSGLRQPVGYLFVVDM